MISIQIATEDQKDQILSTTMLSFCMDPFVRWATHDSHQYLTRYADLFMVSIKAGIANRSAYFSSGFLGIAVWFPPGIYAADQEIVTAIQNLGPSPLRELMEEAFEKFLAFHPEVPHWYLPFMGVDPNFQGQGIGSSLLKHVLDICDSKKEIAYLEASSTRNMYFYQRHGFEVLGSFKVGDSPNLFPMIRKPNL